MDRKHVNNMEKHFFTFTAVTARTDMQFTVTGIEMINAGSY